MRLLWKTLLKSVLLGQNVFILGKAAQNSGFAQNSFALAKAAQNCLGKLAKILIMVYFLL